MNTYKTIAGLGLLVACGGGVANAAESVRSNELRIGAYFVMYDAKAKDITGPFVPAGTNLDVKNVNTMYLAYLRRLSPHYSIELAFGVPPKTDTIGKGPATLGSVPFNGQVVSTAKWFAPNVLLCYTFFDEGATIRPYLEAGVNYTHFYDRQSTAAGDAVNGGPTAISLSNSVGPVITGGVTWQLPAHWSLHASYSRTWVKSDYVGNTAGVMRRTHVDFNPSAVVVSVGYAF
jgi:outer membrane protein